MSVVNAVTKMIRGIGPKEPDWENKSTPQEIQETQAISLANGLCEHDGFTDGHKEEIIKSALGEFFPQNPWLLGKAIYDHLMYQDTLNLDNPLEYSALGIYAQCLSEMIKLKMPKVNVKDSMELLNIASHIVELAPSDYEGAANQLLRVLGERLAYDVVDSLLDDPMGSELYRRIPANEKKRFLDLLEEGKVKRIGTGVLLADHKSMSAFCGNEFEESLKGMTVDEVKKILLATVQSPPDGGPISKRAQAACKNLSRRLPGGANEVHSFLDGENIDTYWKGTAIWP